MMRKAANSSSRKSVRRPSYASVASVGMVGRTPWNRPKLDSRPQIATITERGTPNRVDARWSSARCVEAIVRAVRTARGGTRLATY